MRDISFDKVASGSLASASGPIRLQRPHLSVQEIRAVCAQKNGDSQQFRQFPEMAGLAERREAIRDTAVMMRFGKCSAVK